MFICRVDGHRMSQDEFDEVSAAISAVIDNFSHLDYGELEDMRLELSATGYYRFNNRHQAGAIYCEVLKR